MDTLLNDARYAFRRLRRSPGFTAGVVVILALGIGANAALFSVVDGVLLRPLPVPDPERLVTLWESEPAKGVSRSPMSRGNFAVVRQRNRSFDDVAGFRRVDLSLTSVGEPQRIRAGMVTSSFLPMLGHMPALGRGFLPDDEKLDADRVCVLSDRLWRGAFGADPSVLGREVTLEGYGWTVIGILPAAVPLHEDVDAWIQLRVDPAWPSYWDNHDVEVLARLRDDVSAEQAGAELVALARQLVEEQPEWNGGMSVYLRPLHDELVRDVRANLWILLAAVAFVLLIACVNVAGLLLARAAERQPEIALRGALGAGRGRVLRQLLTESLLLSLGGGVLGLGLAHGGVRALRFAPPSVIPRLDEVTVDLRVAGFTFAVAALTGLVFGLLPSARASKTTLSEVLGQARSNLGRRRAATRSVLVVTEVALAVVLLIGSGLLLRSFVALNRVDPGFEPENRLSMWLTLSPAKYEEMHRISAFFKRLAERLESLPGVHAASAATSLPLTDTTWSKWMSLEERPPERVEEIPIVEYTVALPGYFETLGIPLRAGRRLEPGDDARAPYVAVVSESFVARHFPDQDPLGRRVIMGPPPSLATPGGEPSPVYTIVGVVADVRHETRGGQVPPRIYVGIDQPDGGAGGFYVVVHTKGSAEQLVEPVRRAVWALDPELPISNVRTLESVAHAAVERPRLNLVLIGAFGLLALLLAAAGLYALLAYSVAQRTRELGLRMAIGACRRDVVRLVIGQGVRLTLAGLAAGVAGAAVLTRALRSLLYGVSATDPMTFGAVAAFLALVTLVAAFLPAWRAARLSPTEALRWE